VGRSNCGCGVVAGRERWCAYEQSRNVLSFHGHYARNSTFNQGFRLRTGDGGWGSLSGCNDLATGSREAGAGGGDAGRGFARNPAPGELAGTVAGAGSVSAPTRPALGSVSHFSGLLLSPTSCTSNARTDAGNHAKPRVPAFTSRTRESGIGATFLSVDIRSEPSQEKRRPVSSQTSMSRTPTKPWLSLLVPVHVTMCPLSQGVRDSGHGRTPPV
jgi:hypothetical protein